MRPLEQELMAHACALRALARMLVGEQQADDLVQDTALQALTSPPPRPTGLRSWLAAVMRHRAGKHHRGEGRRRQRERDVTVPESESSPARIAEHKETLQRLTAALLALPEPYLGTLVLRFFEGLPPAAIAARTDTPLATVKSRLQRGLVLLRQQLTAGDRDWRAALVGTFGSGSSIAATTAGVLAMGSSTKLVLCGVAVAGAVLLWCGREVPPDAASRGTAPLVAPLAAAAGVEPSAATSSTDLPHEPLATRIAVDPRTADAVIRGRLVDEQGRPLAGSTVTLRGRRVTGGGGKDFVREYADWLRAHGGNTWRDPELITGTDGTFEFAVQPSPLNLGLRLRRDRLDSHLSVGQMLQAETRDLGDLCVPCTCHVRILVIDNRGVPMRTPAVAVRRIATDDLQSGNRPVPTQDYGEPVLLADGTSTVALTAGHYRCSVDREVERGAEFVVAPGATSLQHEVVVASLAGVERLAGVVVDERQLPVAGVAVQAWNGVAGACARTEPDGRFTLYRPATGSAEVRLSLTKDGYEPSLVETLFRFDASDVRLVVRATAALAVHVVSAADGMPVEDYFVRRWWDPDAIPGAYVNEGAACADGHHPDGVAVVTEIARGDHLLVVESQRWDLWRSSPQPVQVTVPRQARVEVRLGPAADRLLRVRRADGSPLPHASVELVEADAPFGAATPTAEIDRWSPQPPVRTLLLQSGATDAAGQVLLHGPGDRALTLRVACEGVSPKIISPVWLDDPAPLVVTLPASARLVVHVGPPAMVRELRAVCGLPPEGPAPRQGSRGKPGFRLLRGDRNEREIQPTREQASLPIAGDGTVVFDVAPAGSWQLGLDTFEEIGGRLQCWNYPVGVASVTLTAGATTELYVDLGDWLPGVLDGTVTCNGELVCNAPIVIEVERPGSEFPWPQRWLLNAETDDDGHFRLRTRAGALRVAVDFTARHRAAVGPASYQLVYAARQLSLAPGCHLVETFAIEATALRIRLRDPRGAPIGGVPLTLVDPDSGRQHTTVASDADGWITCDVEPATFALQVLPRALSTEPAQREYLSNHRGERDALGAACLPLGQVVARRGEVVEVVVDLPAAWER